LLAHAVIRTAPKVNPKALTSAVFCISVFPIKMINKNS